MWLWAGAELPEQAAVGCWGGLFIFHLVLRSSAHTSARSGFSLRQCLSWHCLTSHHLCVVDVHLTCALAHGHGGHGAILASMPPADLIALAITAHADSHTTLPN